MRVRAFRACLHIQGTTTSPTRHSQGWVTVSSVPPYLEGLVPLEMGVVTPAALGCGKTPPLFGHHWPLHRSFQHGSLVPPTWEVSEPKATFRLSGLPFPAVLQAEKLRLQDLPKSPAALSELGLIFGFPDSQAQTCPSDVRKKLAAV